MKVYVVSSVESGDSDILNICATKELALAKLSAARTEAEESGDYNTNFYWEIFELEES